MYEKSENKRTKSVENNMKKPFVTVHSAKKEIWGVANCLYTQRLGLLA